MEKRRMIFFWVAMFAIMFGWMTFGPSVCPALFPKPKPVVQKNADKNDADGKAADEKRPAKDEKVAAKAGEPSDERPVADNATAGPGKAEKEKQPAEGEEPAEKPAAEGEKRPPV